MVQHRERELWELSADEKRLLLITFVGGLASIVLGAVMIGAALALTRWEAHRHPDMLNLAMVTVLGVPAGIPVWSKKFRSLNKINPCSPGFRVFATVYVLLASVLVLWWIGVGAGVK